MHRVLVAIFIIGSLPLVYGATSVTAAVPPAGYEDEVRFQRTDWFSDIDPTTPVGIAANYLASAGIIGGFPDGTFRAERLVNRAELAKFITNADEECTGAPPDVYEPHAVGDEVIFPFVGWFSDLIAGEWYIPYVLAAAKCSIIEGYPDGTFKPERPVNTAEMLAMFSRAHLGLEEGVPHTYEDVPADVWYTKYAGVAQENAFFPERSAGRLQPSRSLTRGEVAYVLFLILSPPKRHIKSVTVLSPNGGEAWTKGTMQTIKWQDNPPIPRYPVSCREERPCPPPFEWNVYEIWLDQHYPPCGKNVECLPKMRVSYMIAKNVRGFSYGWSVGEYYDWPVGKYLENPSTVGIVPDGPYTVRVCRTGSTVCDSSDSLFTIVKRNGGNLPPSISGVSGPNILKVGEVGTWGVKAFDPEQGPLSYSVVWGDETVGIVTDHVIAPTQRVVTTQTSTFTHVYSKAGTYVPAFTVTDRGGLSAKTSISVRVGDDEQQSKITVLSPNGGETWARGTVQGINWTDDAHPRCNPDEERCVMGWAEYTYDITLVPYYPPCTGKLCPLHDIKPYVIAERVSVGFLGWFVGGELYNRIIPDGAYTIRVCQTNTLINACDTSDAYFSITTKISGGSAGANLYVMQHKANHHHQVLGGELSDPVFRFDFRATQAVDGNATSVDVTDIILELGGDLHPFTDSIDRLELFESGSASAFAHATHGSCASPGVLYFCAHKPDGMINVPVGTTKEVLVRARMKRDDFGGKSGDVFLLFLRGQGTVEANDSAGIPLVQSDGDSDGEGEVFIPTLIGTDHTTVLAKIVSVENVNPDPDGANIPFGTNERIAEFRFTAAANNNILNGRNKVTLDGIIFTVDSTNVELNDRFDLYNKADQTQQIRCTPYARVNESFFLVECRSADNTSVDLGMGSGEGMTLVLEADITDNQVDSTRDSSLQVSITDFSDYALTTFGTGAGESRIRWSDTLGEPSESFFQWIEFDQTEVSSTSYKIGESF